MKPGIEYVAGIAVCMPATFASRTDESGTTIEVSSRDVASTLVGCTSRRATARRRLRKVLPGTKVSGPMIDAMASLHWGYMLEGKRRRSRWRNDDRGKAYATATFSLFFPPPSSKGEDGPSVEVDDTGGIDGDSLRYDDIHPNSGWIEIPRGSINGYVLSPEGLAVAEAMFGPVESPTVVALPDGSLTVRHPIEWSGVRLSLPEAPVVDLRAGDRAAT